MEPAIDSHAHVHFEGLAEDLGGVLARAREAGITRIVNVGTKPGDNETAVRLAAEHEMLRAAVGFHPHEASAIRPEHWETIERQAARDEVVALGEFGLDYHYEHSPRDAQREVFAEGIRLAGRTGLPMIIHSREAAADTFAMLDKVAGSAMPRGVFHCWTGSPEEVRGILDRGFYVGFTGIVTFNKADNVRASARAVPLERLLVETDCPFCAPEPVRGETNEPAYVAHVIAFLADLYGLSDDDLRRITRRNTCDLFGLPHEAPGRPTVVYPIRNSLYVNVTNRCSNACWFCPRTQGDFTVKGHDLGLDEEPSADEMLRALEAEGAGERDEVVLCGFGEPTLRLDVVLEVAREIKRRWGLPIRLNTNGHASVIAGRDVTPELAGLVDTVSVSLNAADAETYSEVCRPTIPGGFEATLDFIRKAKARGIEVVATAVDLPDADIDAIRRLAEEELGVTFRLRAYNIVG